MRGLLKKSLNARQRGDLRRDKMKKRGIARLTVHISEESARALVHFAHSTGETQSQWIQKLILAAYRQTIGQGPPSSSPSGS